VTGNLRSWPVVLALSLLSAPLVVMYAYLVIDTVTNSPAGSFVPNELTLEHWSFLWDTPRGRPNIWRVTLNSLIFASCSSCRRPPATCSPASTCPAAASSSRA
jgi:inositol-phosphate transport system permease protein